MQKANYNETHGIVVGPELSRIFAEIILQEIDRRVQAELILSGLRHEIDYSIRRYVDDYFIFANSVEELNQIQRSLAAQLESFKLYLNAQKLVTSVRPFVTPLTLARSAVKKLTKNVDLQLKDQTNSAKARGNFIRAALTDIREIVSRYDIQASNVSGWVLSWLRRLITGATKSVEETPGQVAVDTWLEIVRAALDVALHVVALDLRVRTTYSLCQIVKAAFDARESVPSSHFDQIEFLVGERLIAFCARIEREQKEVSHDSLELFNVLICGAHFLRQTFTDNSKVRTTLIDLLNAPRISYFRYVTLKFCFLKDRPAFFSELDSLNAIVERVLVSGEDPLVDSEQFLLLCDFLSAPDVESLKKRRVFDRLFGGVISAAAMDEISGIVGFVDWDGMQVEHTLRRKELRPVYAMA